MWASSRNTILSQTDLTESRFYGRGVRRARPSHVLYVPRVTELAQTHGLDGWTCARAHVLVLLPENTRACCFVGCTASHLPCTLFLNNNHGTTGRLAFESAANLEAVEKAEWVAKLGELWNIGSCAKHIASGKLCKLVSMADELVTVVWEDGA